MNDDYSTAYAAGPGNLAKQPASEIWIINGYNPHRKGSGPMIRLEVPAGSWAGPDWLDTDVADQMLADAGWTRLDPWALVTPADPKLWGANVKRTVAA